VSSCAGGAGKKRNEGLSARGPRRGCGVRARTTRRRRKRTCGVSSRASTTCTAAVTWHGGARAREVAARGATHCAGLPSDTHLGARQLRSQLQVLLRRAARLGAGRGRGGERAARGARSSNRYALRRLHLQRLAHAQRSNTCRWRPTEWEGGNVEVRPATTSESPLASPSRANGPYDALSYGARATFQRAFLLAGGMALQTAPQLRCSAPHAPHSPRLDAARLRRAPAAAFRAVRLPRCSAHAPASAAPRAAAPPRAQPTHVAHLLVSCPDQKGVVAALAQLLYGYGVNIITSDQFSDTAEQMYYQRITVDYGECVPPKWLSRPASACADASAISIGLPQADCGR